MDKRETIAIESVKLAVEMFDSGELDASSEASMTALEDAARKIANVMMSLAAPMSDLINPPQEPGPMVHGAQPQPEAVQAPDPVIYETHNPAPAPAPAQPAAEPFPQPQPASEFQAPAAAPAVNAPPAAGYITTTSTNDEMWAAIVSELQAENGGHTANWWDNRLSKKGEKASDFRHKTLKAASKKTGQEWPLAVWMNTCPDWARAIVNQYAPPEK